MEGCKFPDSCPYQYLIPLIQSQEIQMAWCPWLLLLEWPAGINDGHLVKGMLRDHGPAYGNILHCYTMKDDAYTNAGRAAYIDGIQHSCGHNLNYNAALGISKLNRAINYELLI